MSARPDGATTKSADFLLELLSEEIPARMQERAAADLVRLFEAELAKAGLEATGIESFVTPRRLALIARGLPLATEAVSEEIKGPRADAPPQALAGFLGKTGLTRDQLVERTDAKGNAVLFAVIERAGRPTPEVLADAVATIIRSFPWPKAMRWGAASLSTESARWVRPLQGIVALFGEAIVPVEIAGVASGAATVGHRFHHPGAITIGSAADYVEKLRACHVVVDSEERRQIIRDGARVQAASLGLVVIPDEGLVAENAGLTEWPVPLIGQFDPEFLSVPQEVIQLTMRTNQKYFSLAGPDGQICKNLREPEKQENWSLAPAFVCTANIDASDGGAAIVAGNAKVLAARLADARFFWEQDLKVPLAVQAEKLSGIVFHEKLGTVADKVERVAKLARWLVDEGIVGAKPLPFRGGVGVGPASADPAPGEAPHPPTPSPEGEGGRAALADMAEQAARLAKADLVTGMVGEFPELQGVMGGYYARAESLPDAVADAIRDHYKPVGQGDDVPTAPVTVAVSLADKLDTLAAFFSYQMPPSGSKDPFALRRAALAVLNLLVGGKVRLPLSNALLQVIWELGWQPIRKKQKEDPLFARFLEVVWPEWPTHLGGNILAERGEALLVTNPELQPYLKEQFGEFTSEMGGVFRRSQGAIAALLDFFADRLKVQQREAGVRHDLIDAVFALGGEDDLVRLLARVKALQAFVETEEGKNLLAGYRRAANILRAEAKKADGAPAEFAGFPYDPDPAERALADALDAQLPLAGQAIVAEDFAAAMTALSTIRPAIDRFFDDVTVNADDPDRRTTRLALLAKLVAAMHKVADFSKIEG